MKKNTERQKIRQKFCNQNYPLLFGALLLFLLFSIAAAVTFGNADISLEDVYSVIGYELFHIERLEKFSEGAIHDVVWLIRFPRVLMALGIGMGLSVCGAVMQAVVKNPLADPYVLGISSGASLGATLGILFGFGSLLGTNFIGIMAFLGAVATSFLVLLIANVNGPVNAGKLILVGMAVSAVCAAFSNFSLYIANNADAAAQVMFWTMGSLASAKWEQAAVILPVITAGTLVFWTQYRNLNLMLLGDEVSVTLGTNLHRMRNFYMVLSSMMIGFCVYAAGTIGFIGLIIPHAVRMCVGTEHKRLLPLCAATGGVFLIWADVLCRTVLKHSELPIGILVSLIGAPCFIYLMVKRSYGFGGRS